MTRFWIRVNARLADDAEVRSFARAIFPKLDTWVAVDAACGLLVTLWGRVVDEQEDGNLSSRDDDLIEEWAKWGGKPGVLARAFRERFTDHGIIREWDDYQGPLIARRERDRVRKAAEKDAEGKAEKPTVPRRRRAEKKESHAEVREHSSGNGNDKALVSVPDSTERQELAPSALAPEGARDGATNEQRHRELEVYAKLGLRPGEQRRSAMPSSVHVSEVVSEMTRDLVPVDV